MTGTGDWTRPEWLADARAWVEAHLAERGQEIAGELEQPHVQWWSTAIRVPATDGVYWFKASGAAGGFEARLTELLARLFPDRTAELVALDGERRWMLTRDAGTKLRDLIGGRDDLTQFEQLLPRYGELQLALAERVDELLSLGVPDLRLATLPGLLRRAVTDPEVPLLVGADALTASERDALDDGIAAFDEICARLAAYGFPETLQHDDFHEGNIFVRNGSHVFFDWGDACVSHPFHTLAVTLRALAWRYELEPGGPEVTRLRDAYLEPWTELRPRADVRAAADLARRTGTIQRAMAWYRGTAGLPPDVRTGHNSAVPYGLKLYLGDGPYGTWE